MRDCFIGVDLGGTKVAIALADEKREIFAKIKFKTDKNLGGSELVHIIAEEIMSLLGENGKSAKNLLAIGVGAPSFVDFKTGHILTTANIPNLQDIAMRDIFAEHFDCPIFIDNDANVAAIAEHKRGAGIGFPDMIYLTASTGIGGGIILCDKVFRGSYSLAGEVGHMLLTPGKGALCGCGNRGCFESYISGANIYKNVQLRLDAGQSTIMTTYVQNVCDISGEHLLKALDLGDEMAKELFESICYYFGLLCYNLYIALNVNCIVVGGGLTNFGQRLFDNIRNSFESFRPQNKQFEVNVLPAAAGQDFGMIGAVELAADSI